MMAIETSVEKSPKIAISALRHRRRTLRLFQRLDRVQLNFFPRKFPVPCAHGGNDHPAATLGATLTASLP